MLNLTSKYHLDVSIKIPIKPCTCYIMCPGSLQSK